MSGFLLACIAAATTVALFVLWQGIIRRVEMDKRRWFLNSMAVAAIALALAIVFEERRAARRRSGEREHTENDENAERACEATHPASGRPCYTQPGEES